MKTAKMPEGPFCQVRAHIDIPRPVMTVDSYIIHLPLQSRIKAFGLPVDVCFNITFFVDNCYIRKWQVFPVKSRIIYM